MGEEPVGNQVIRSLDFPFKEKAGRVTTTNSPQAQLSQAKAEDRDDHDGG